jgi:ribosomal protein S15
MLCEKVINTMLHVEKNKHDHKAVRTLITALSKRRKLLNLLKKEDYHMYRLLFPDNQLDG